MPCLVANSHIFVCQQYNEFSTILRSRLPLPYSEVFREWFVCVVAVALTQSPEKWSAWAVPELDRFKKLRGQGGAGFFGLTIYLTPPHWNGRSAFHVRRTLAEQMVVGARMIVERSANSKIPLDSQRFLNDVDAAMLDFVRASPAVDGDERLAAATWTAMSVFVPELPRLGAGSAYSKPIPRERRSPRPSRIRLVPDESHCEHVGRLANGDLYFATQVARYRGHADEFDEYLAVYRFGSDGKLASAGIDDLSNLDASERDAIWSRRLDELGARERIAIEIEPFKIRRNGCTFGLVPLRPEDPEDGWRVVNEPGASMVFMEPWDGCYDT